MANHEVPQSGSDLSTERRTAANRALIVITVAMVVIGVFLGQTLTTWLNATLL